MRFLREYWGFTQLQLAEKDPYWKSIFGKSHTLRNASGVQKCEKGKDKQLKDKHLIGIAKAFNIPLEILEDHFPFDEFERIAKTEYEVYKKYSKGGLKREDPIPNRDNLLGQLQKYAIEWRTNGFPYNIPENEGKIFKAYTVMDHEYWEKPLSDEEMAFLMMVSLHYNAGWEKWVPLNTNNTLAIRAMVKGLHVNYWRTRFRTLYALQKVSIELINEELEKDYNKDLSEKTVDAIKTHGFDKTVVSFLKSVANGLNAHIASKAKQVLTEIADRWHDPEMTSEVPL